MPDFSVPLATNLLGSIDPLIANAPGAMKIGEAIGNLPDAYWAGQNQAFQQRNRNLFEGANLPRDTSGGIDFRRAAEMALQAGGAGAINNAIALGDYDVERRALEQNRGAGYGVTGAGPPAPYATPLLSNMGSPSSAVPSTTRVVGDKEGAERGLYEAPAAPGQRPPLQTEPQAQQPQQAAASFGQRYAASTENPAFQAQRQQMEAQAKQYEDAAANNFRLGATLSKNNPGAGARYQAMGEAAAKTAQGLRDTINKLDEPPPAQRDYELARRQGYAGTFQQYQTDQEAGKAEAVKQAATLAKLAESGIDAKGKLAQLNEVQRLGEKVGYGAVPKLQSFLGNYGINTTGLSDIQAYERAIDFMAPQLRPVGSGRLMQKELAAFKSSLGGLMTTPEGRRISVENLKLIHEFGTEVGEIAADTSLGQSERLKKIYALPAPELSTTWTGPTGAVYIVRNDKIVGRAR